MSIQNIASSPRRPHKITYIPRQWRWALLLVVAGLVALTGCRSGTYPIDFFSEMHYQDSVKSQEPPRLAPPENSVPITGKEIAYTTEESRLLANSLQPGGQDLKLGKTNLQIGAELFRINCSMCHGFEGKGGNSTPLGVVTALLIALGSPPADLTIDPTSSRTDGDIYNIITRGAEVLEGKEIMPPFKNLLTPDERWAIIIHIRELQQGQ